MQQKFVDGMVKVGKGVILFLMVILMLAMVFGTVDLTIKFYQSIVTPNPLPFLINVEDLYLVFSVLLIIAIGYELLKSLLLIISSDEIPIGSILKIAGIAMANKIITMNLKEVSLYTMLGISAVLAAIGLAFFFFNKENKKSL